MSTPKFYRLAYQSVKQPLIHNLRDADSFAQLMPLLIRKGYEFGGLWLNFASDTDNDSSQSNDFSPQRGDVIVMTTRPPLDDDEDGPHLVISKSGRKIETDIFTAIRPYLTKCSRRQVILDKSLKDKFKPGFNDRISIQFAGHGKKRGKKRGKKNTRYFNEARYQASFAEDNRFTIWNHKDGCRTAAYLLYMGEAWNGGPDLLINFAMTGAMNLIWANLIRTRFPQFLESYRIVLAELIFDDLPEVPVDLSFSEDCNVNIVLNHEL